MLEINNLYFRYSKKDQLVLNDLSLKLSDGKLGIILGINGSGKSTLFKVINRIVIPTSGTIKLDNLDIEKIKITELSKMIAYVPQEQELTPLTIYETVLLGRLPYFGYNESEEDRKVVDEVLKKYDLYDIKDKCVNILSGGLKQRVVIARAMVKNPKLVIFDEPTNSLDIKNELFILAEAKKLSQSGISVLMSVHDLNIALKYADVLYLLKDGRIIQNGNSDIITESSIKDLFDLDVEIVKIKNQKYIIYKDKEK